MSRGFRLRGLSPTVVLEVLGELGSDLDPLWIGGMRGRLRTSALGAESLLFVPETATAAAHGSGPYQRLLELLKRRATHFEWQSHELGSETWHPLEGALPQFLLASGADDEASKPQPGEWLLLDRRRSGPKAAKLCEDLRFHATHMRIAVCRERDGAMCHLVHVRSDPVRRSSFEGLLAGHGLEGIERLTALRVAAETLPASDSAATGATRVPAQTLFLPADRLPSRRALAAFRRLLQALPQIQGLPPGAINAERLLALVASSPEAGAEAERGQVYPLAGLDFVDQALLTPRPSPDALLEIHPLESSAEELAKLQRRIRGAKPLVGYRLELRPGYCAPGLEGELERVVEKLTELEQRRAYLENIHRPRPILLRFNQHQLPALADAVRCFPQSELVSGRIRYAFQATPGNPAGWHYLLYDPGETVQTESYPPWRWSDLDPDDSGTNAHRDSMRFWLDPLWAKHYHGSNVECLLFVPHGSMLFPTPHSWDSEDMDSHLRSLVEQWFPTEHGRNGPLTQQAAAREVPLRALFLFETRENENIRIQVLDLDGFTPFREHIGWLNDNLTLEHAFLGARDWVSSLATDISRRRLAEELRQQAKSASEGFAHEAEQANREMAKQATELLQIMTEELAALAGRCRGLGGELKQLYHHLDEAETVLENLKRTDQGVRTAVKQGEQAVGANARLIEALGRSLTRQQARREAVEQEVARAVRELEGRLRKLREELHRA